MGEVASLLPASGLAGVGAGGLLVLVVLYLLTSNRADRRDYQEAIDKAEARADLAEKRKREAEAEAEAERVRRRAAEDKADAYARELAARRPPESGGTP